VPNRTAVGGTGEGDGEGEGDGLGGSGAAGDAGVFAVGLAAVGFAVWVGGDVLGRMPQPAMNITVRTSHRKGFSTSRSKTFSAAPRRLNWARGATMPRA
jgi:hypothetical protein